MPAEILLFSTPACPIAAKLRDILTSKGVKFRDLDVSTDREALVLLLRYAGQPTVPAIVAYGEVMVGFDPLRLEQLLEGLPERAERFIRSSAEEDEQLRETEEPPLTSD